MNRYYDEINQADTRSLEPLIHSAVKGVLSVFGAISFEDVLVQVCYQLAITATRKVIEMTKHAYNELVDRYKNR